MGQMRCRTGQGAGAEQMIHYNVGLLANGSQSQVMPAHPATLRALNEPREQRVRRVRHGCRPPPRLRLDVATSRPDYLCDQLALQSACYPRFQASCFPTQSTHWQVAVLWSGKARPLTVYQLMRTFCPYCLGPAVRPSLRYVRPALSVRTARIEYRARMRENGGRGVASEIDSSAEIVAKRVRGGGMSTNRTFNAEEWAEAGAIVLCEAGEGREWLTSRRWRGAWWIRGSVAERVASWSMIAEAGEVLRWQDPEAGGSVWIGLAPDGGHLRIVAVCGPAVAVKEAVLAWDALRELALDTERREWLHWWEAVARIKGRASVPPEDLREGRLCVFELADGSGAAIGRIHEIQRGRVVALRTTAGSVLQVREGGRGWAWADKWRDAAAHVMVERKGEPFKSVDSVLWTVVHKRKRMVRDGLLPADPPQA